MKKALSILLVFVLALAFAGCGGTKAKDVDVNALAKELVKKVKFDSELTELTAEQLGNYLTVPEGAKVAAYMSNGTTAEEIIVVRCGDEAAAKVFKTALEGFLAEQSAEMARYMPAEVARIEKAVLSQRGACVALCVTDDTANAEKIIKEHLG